MKRKFQFLNTQGLGILGMAALLTFTSCDSDEPTPETVVTPTTYTFENVDYSGQTARIQLLSMLESKAKSANDGATVVTADELNAIFTNEAKNFNTEKNISGKTAEVAIPEIQGYFQDIETYSGSTDNIIGGRLFTETGIEPAQMIAKGLMGALLYYQATSVYLGDDKMSVDNTEVVEGKGTAMQHHWDEAFGYFGAPADYLTGEEPADSNDPTEKTWYWAKYANGRADVVDVRGDIFNAFIEGRAAIGRGDLEARDAAIETIKENWELLIAANVVHYLNSAQQDLVNENEGNFYHHLSEGIAFLNTLQYNLDKSISSADLQALNELLGDNPKASFASPAETTTALDEAKVKLQQIFGFTDQQILKL